MTDETFRGQITRRAQKDIGTLTPKLKKKLREILINRIAVNPFDGKRLVGDFKGCWSVRLTLKDRVIYSIDEKTVSSISSVQERIMSKSPNTLIPRKAQILGPDYIYRADGRQIRNSKFEIRNH